MTALAVRPVDLRSAGRRGVDVAADWDDALDGYTHYLHGRRYQPSTVDRYMKTARRLSRWMREPDRLIGPWEVTTSCLRDFLDASGASGSSSNELLKTICYFYEWAERRGLVRPSPAAALPRRRLEQISAPAAWQQAWSDFATHLAAKRAAPGTINQRRVYVRRFAEFCGPIAPFEVGRHDLEDWLAAAAWKPSTHKVAQCSLRVFYQWAEDEGLVVVSPAKKLPSVRVPRAHPRPASEETIDDALANVPERERLMVLLGAHAGLRAMEIAELHCRDVEFTVRRDAVGVPRLGGNLHVVGKGGHQRTVPLAPDGELVVALKSWVGNRRDAVFPGRVEGHLSRKYVSTLLSRRLGADATGHMLRHRFASVSYADTRDLRVVQVLLGHSKPETTTIYTAVVDGSLLEAVVAASRRR